jgi:hypothetical protein
MFQPRELTTRAAETAAAQAAAMASRSIFFLAIIKGWSGLELSLTCRQGEFAEDLSEEGMRTQASGTG